MDNSIMFEFQSPCSNDGELDFSFSGITESEDASLSVTAMQGKDAVLVNYDYFFDQSSGEVGKSSSLELTKYRDYHNPGPEEPLNDLFKNNLVIKKVEFDRENDKLVTARVEFEADTEEDAKNIKDKVKAYGIAVK